MSRKRPSELARYQPSEDEQYTDEDDDETTLEELVEEERARPGRPRVHGSSQASAKETATSFGTMSGRGRRGRGPSKRPCLNRNAQMARENRQKKKEYIQRIEAKLNSFQAENQELNSTIQKQSSEIKRLNQEVAYLKTVLNNQTNITNLLRAMNDSLRRMHQADGPATGNANANRQAKTSADIANWLVSGQANASKINSTSGPLSGTSIKDNSEVSKGEVRRANFGQNGSPPKIARKTMPLTQCVTLKSEDPPSVESYLEEDDKRFVQKSSPESDSHCEYNTDRSSMGLDNQLPTPMSIMSNSMDKGEASLSDTDFSQLSSFDVDLFGEMNNLDGVADPLPFEQDTPDLFSEEALFQTLETDTAILNNDGIDSMAISSMSEALNEKTLFQSIDNAGVCLHINSTRVSLEYCSVCHLNSLNSAIV